MEKLRTFTAYKYKQQNCTDPNAHNGERNQYKNKLENTEIYAWPTYISKLYRELDVIAECKILEVILELAEMKEDLFDNICTFDEAVIILQRAHDALTDAVRRCRFHQFHTSSANVTISAQSHTNQLLSFPTEALKRVQTFNRCHLLNANSTKSY